jgi:hypothetical protein
MTMMTTDITHNKKPEWWANIREEPCGGGGNDKQNSAVRTYRSLHYHHSQLFNMHFDLPCMCHNVYVFLIFSFFIVFMLSYRMQGRCLFFCLHCALLYTYACMHQNLSYLRVNRTLHVSAFMYLCLFNL